jgi:drug/metabolite transporter (DMT)-like permease
VLTGASPEGGWWGVAGTLAVVVASLSYAGAGLWGQHLISRVSGPVLSTASLVGASVLMLPFGIAQAPGTLPGWKPVASVLALAVLGTAAAQLLWFRLLRRYGSSRSSLVTYLLPITALAYGSVFLDEPLHPSALIGLVLILGGVALGSGVLRLPRRAALPQSP